MTNDSDSDSSRKVSVVGAESSAEEMKTRVRGESTLPVANCIL